MNPTVSSEAKKRFDEELIDLLLQLKWWDYDPQELTGILPLLCCPELDRVKTEIRRILEKRQQK